MDIDAPPPHPAWLGNVSEVGRETGTVLLPGPAFYYTVHPFWFAGSRLLAIVCCQSEFSYSVLPVLGVQPQCVACLDVHAAILR